MEYSFIKKPGNFLPADLLAKISKHNTSFAVSLKCTSKQVPHNVSLTGLGLSSILSNGASKYQRKTYLNKRVSTEHLESNFFSQFRIDVNWWERGTQVFSSYKEGVKYKKLEKIHLAKTF